MTSHPEFESETADQPESIMEPTLWVNKGWTARVIKNQDDDGWAVEMIKDGEPEPALIGPWTMWRDKKNPKPLDVNAFNTLVKTASEVVRRHEQHMHAIHHKKLMITVAYQQIQIALDIVPDEDDPHALLSAQDQDGEQLAQVKVSAGFKLNTTSAYAWAENDYRKPG
jgi:hypothetical protein